MKNSKGFALVPFLIILALAVVGVYFYVSQKPFPYLVKNLSPTADVGTANWQTYRNEQYGFEVKYPEGWKILQGEDRDRSEIQLIGEKQLIQIVLRASDSYLNYLKAGTKSVNLQYAGLIWETYFHKENNPGDFANFNDTLVMITNYNGGSFIIKLSPNANTIVGSVFDQILSTFKFTR